MPKILLVEDNQDVRTSLMNILSDAGYDVVEAPNAEEGLQKVYDEQPDLILTDVVMSGMDGFQMVEKIRDNPATRDISVVMLAGTPIIQDEARAMSLNIRHFIPKPGDPGFVKLTIRVALREAGIAPE